MEENVRQAETNARQAETFEDALAMAQEQIAHQGGAVLPEGEMQDARAVSSEEAPPDIPPEQLAQQIQQEQTPQTAESQQAPPNDMFVQMRQQNQQLMQQNQQLQNMIREMSGRNQETVVEQALTPPELDLAALWSEDENVIRQKQTEYAQQMAEYTEKKLMNQLSPLLESAKQSMAEKERQNALNGLSQVPELAGIMGMTDTLEKIIRTNPALSGANIPLEDKLITAYAIAKGAEAIKNGLQPPPEQKQPGVEDFIQMYSQDPDLQKRVEQIRAKNAAGNAVDVPPMSASSGVFNAALSVKEEPKNFEDAKRLAMATWQ